MRLIPVTRAGETIAYASVDDADFQRVAALNWYLHPKGYVQSTRQREVLLLHRFILGCTKGDRIVVDHENGDKLDNRRSNLRRGNHSLNGQNRGANGGTSQHRGVHYDRRRDRWIATARLNRARTHIGSFHTEEEAAEAAAAFRAEHMPFSAEFVERRKEQEMGHVQEVLAA